MADFVNLTYDEVLTQFDIIYNNPNILLYFCNRHFPAFGSCLKKAKDAVNAVINDEEIINSLGDVEINIVIGGLSSFPLLLLKDDRHPELEKSCSAIILLLNNYLQLFPNDELKEVVDTIHKLFILQDRFTSLIVAADMLLLQSKNCINTVDYFGVSKNFVDAILNEKGDN